MIEPMGNQEHNLILCIFLQDLQISCPPYFGPARKTDRPESGPAADAQGFSPAPAAVPDRRKGACRLLPITVSAPFSMASTSSCQCRCFQIRHRHPARCRRAHYSPPYRQSSSGSCPRYPTVAAISRGESSENSFSPKRTEPPYGASQRNTRPNVDFPQATGPVTPIMSPGWAVSEIPEKTGCIIVCKRKIFKRSHQTVAGQPAFPSSSGDFISGLIRFHETSAFCTELNSFATLEDLTVSFVKQERNVVNAAISHALHPRPQNIFCAEPQNKQHTGTPMPPDTAAAGPLAIHWFAHRRFFIGIQ